MISRVEALNYRCLRYIDQNLGPFQLLVGANATGKKTFLDDEVAQVITVEEVDELDATSEMRGWLKDMFLIVHDPKLSRGGCSS